MRNCSKKIDWKKYNKELVKRGFITFLFSDQVLKGWCVQAKGVKGFQQIYSDVAIETLVVIRERFAGFLRATQGLAQSIILWELTFPYLITVLYVVV